MWEGGKRRLALHVCVNYAYCVTVVICGLGVEWLDGSWIVCDKHWQLATMGHQVPLMFTLKVCAPLYGGEMFHDVLMWTPDPSGCTRKGLGNNLAQKCLAANCHRPIMLKI